MKQHHMHQVKFKLNSNINALKGQVNLLNEQIDNNESKIEDFTNKTLIYIFMTRRTKLK